MAKRAKCRLLQSKESWDYAHVTQGLRRYDFNDESKNVNIPRILKIIVDSEESKLQLLKASEYIHNLRSIDSDFMMVSTLMHLYHAPDLIEVQSEL